MFLLASYKSGEAIKIELYVPNMVPNNNAKINQLIDSGQKIKIVKRTKNKVKLVYILLTIVSDIDKLIIS
ncbi:MAG: hypothetical protein Q8S84_08665 [bacterium]|nr:hypothetical protein [bacterium]MDP3381501.1 hypothetical protein [bacterium]